MKIADGAAGGISISQGMWKQVEQTCIRSTANLLTKRTVRRNGHRITEDLRDMGSGIVILR